MKIFYFFNGFVSYIFLAFVQSYMCFILGCNCHFLYLQKEKLARPFSSETPARRAVRHPRRPARRHLHQLAPSGGRSTIGFGAVQ
jgi:hypothetical protein